ncbi:MAG: type VI secretion system baseplate subunit TssE [Gammaproteobacteria bacterium]|nr:type VI secretion system baseplate subunit TssE [Gammaproteobacteria bacterium]
MAEATSTFAGNRVLPARQRLLERYASLAKPNLSKARQDEAIQQSVIDYVTRLLNIRLGSVPLDPALGVGEFAQLTAKSNSPHIQQLTEEIRQLIVRYEPRAKAVEVRFGHQGGSDMTLQFQLAMQITVASGERAVAWQTAIGHDR